MPGAYQQCLQRFVNHPIVYCTIQFVRWIPVIFIVGVLCWSYYAYVIELCLVTITSYLKKTLYIIIYHILLFMLLWSYYQCVFADIGRPSASFHPPSDVVREIDSATSPTQVRMILERFSRQSNLPITMRAFDGTIRYCEKCHCIKPDRCHHCSICGHCILKFDHHCPWVNTCVNFRNYKFFIHFLGYALLFCLWAFLTDIQYFVCFWREGLSCEGRAKFHIMFMFFVAGMFAISVSTLFFYHLWLTSRNRSTIESFRDPMFIYGPDKSGFNLGIKRNFREVFGEDRLLWFLPLFSSRGEGMTFPTRVTAPEPPEVEAAPPCEPERPLTPDQTVQQCDYGATKLSPTTLRTVTEEGQTHGDGMVFPMPTFEPEADGLLNGRLSALIDEENSEEEESEFEHQDSQGMTNIPLSSVAVLR